jgi:hypothetical protein
MSWGNCLRSAQLARAVFCYFFLYCWFFSLPGFG